jgi:transposase, IS5 family
MEQGMQKGFSELEYLSKRKVTRRDVFLSKLEELTPWQELEQSIEPYYPKQKGSGRPTRGLSRMLRMYLVQQCFGLSDVGIEDSIYDSQSIRHFVGIDLLRESAPDATTLLKFRRLLEEHHLTKKILDTINAHLSAQGLLMREGTIVDATLIAAPTSTKNKDKARDPEMHASKKGNQWHFGMKGHIGVDADSGIVHSVVGTSGHVSDISQAHALLHGKERGVLADAGYQGVDKRPENKNTSVTWYVAQRPGKRRALEKNAVLGQLNEQIEHLKASIRAKVEHPFHIIKNLFHHKKTRYRGLFKNTAQLFTLFAMANLMIAARQIIPKLDLNSF